MMRTKREQSAATTERLITLARSLFAEHGYAGVNLEHLVARADVTRGAVYHHFQSKQGLFEAVLRSVHAEVGAAVSQAAAGFVDPWEQLVAGSHAFVTAASDPTVRRVLLIDGPAVLGWQRWREFDAANSGAMLDDVLRSLAGAELIDPSLVGASAAMLSGAMNEAALWLARPDATQIDHDSAHATLDRMLTAIR